MLAPRAYRLGLTVSVREIEIKGNLLGESGRGQSERA